ncbi:MAG: hypothetical protein QM687_14560 [Ferruginibacter sp.]
MNNFDPAVIIILSVVGIWLLPIISILRSERTGKNEKIAWILAVVFISWFAWIFYFLLAPLKPVKKMN